MAKKTTKLAQSIIRGDTPLLQFPITVNGAAVDLTGWKCTLTVTANESPTNADVPVIQIPVDGDTTGILNYQFLQGQSLNDTLLLDPESTYYFDVELNNNLSGADKRVFTPIRGNFEVEYDYTVGTV